VRIYHIFKVQCWGKAGLTGFRITLKIMEKVLGYYRKKPWHLWKLTWKWKWKHAEDNTRKQMWTGTSRK